MCTRFKTHNSNKSGKNSKNENRSKGMSWEWNSANRSWYRSCSSRVKVTCLKTRKGCEIFGSRRSCGSPSWKGRPVLYHSFTHPFKYLRSTACHFVVLPGQPLHSKLLETGATRRCVQKASDPLQSCELRFNLKKMRWPALNLLLH